jgi:hypothetical protein
MLKYRAMAMVLVLLLLALVPHTVWGQTPGAPPPSGIEFDPRTPPPPTIPSAPVTVSPVGAPAAARSVQLFEFHPLLGLSEEYSDNFNRSARNHQDNFRSMVSPGMNVRLDTGLLTGGATYTLSGVHDSSVGDFGYFNTFGGQLSWQATPLFRLSTAGSVNQSDQPDQADSLGLRLGRRKFTIVAGSLGADWAIEPITLSPYYRASYFKEDDGAETLTHNLGANGSLSIAQIHRLTLGYEHLMSESSGTGGSESEFETTGHQFIAAFSRDLGERTTAGISGSYALRTRDKRTPDAETNFRRWSASLFSNYAVPSTIALRVSVGVSQLSSDTSDRKPVLSTSSSLSYWFGRAVATISFDRGYSETFSAGEDQGVVLTTGGGGSLSYSFTQSLTGRVNVAYHENEFTGIGGTPAPTGTGRGGTTRTDKVLTGGLGLSFQILRWLGTSLDYTHSRIDSDGLDGDIVENRATLSLNFIF